MAKEPQPASDGNGSDEAHESEGTGQGPELNVAAQFIKDLSFESPNAPGSLQGPGDNPKLEINVNVQATKSAEDMFEVDLHFEGKATSDSGVIYNIELVYAGLFRLRYIPENVLQAVLFVDCPTILFPFMRRLVADLTQEGGFPPLMLDPMDFASLYKQNAQQVAGAPAN